MQQPIMLNILKMLIQFIFNNREKFCQQTIGG